MSHELSIVNGRAEMFAAGERPWHGLGTLLPERVTSFEAMIAAHLNWTADLFPVQAVLPNGEVSLDPLSKAIVRTDTNQVLGIMGKRYRIMQNHEAFTFFDSVIGEGQAVYETAGALFGGRKVWILACLKGDMNIGKNDTVKKYLLFTNSHDGSSSIRMFFTPVRVVCNNTLTMANHRGSLGNMVQIRHTESMKGKVEQAQEILGLAKKTYDILQEHFNKFYSFHITESQAAGYFKSTFDLDLDKKNDKEFSEELLKSYGSDRINGNKDTVWAAYNTVTGYVDHTMTRIKSTSKRSLEAQQNNRMKSLCFGNGAEIKGKALHNACALVS